MAIPFYRITFFFQRIYAKIKRVCFSSQSGPYVPMNKNYRQISNICRTLVDNEIVDHSVVDGASSVGAAPTTSSFST